MKKLSLGLVLCSVFAAQAGAFETTATVVRSEPMYQRVETPHQRCVTEQVQQTVQTGGERNYTGSIVGGIAGALLGSNVGGGNGNKAAIAAGAIGGALVGDHLAGQSNGGPSVHTQTVPVERCSTVYDSSEQISGYRVTYSYGGHEYVTTMPTQPGRTIVVDVNVNPRNY